MEHERVDSIPVEHVDVPIDDADPADGVVLVGTPVIDGHDPLVPGLTPAKLGDQDRTGAAR